MIHNFIFEFELEIEGAAKASAQAAAKLDRFLQWQFRRTIKVLKSDYPKLKLVCPESNRRVKHKRG